MSHAPIKLSRPVEAVQIPSGKSIPIPAQTEVLITQALGGSFTVVIPTIPGLYRIAGKDGDALGHDPIHTQAAPPLADGSADPEAVWTALKTCYDPEIPVNIVDLGLIYSLDLEPVDGGSRVKATMTLTAPGCGMGPAIAADAREKILAVPGVKEAEVGIVWEPAWSPNRITPEGREKLGMV